MSMDKRESTKRGLRPFWIAGLLTVTFLTIMTVSIIRSTLFQGSEDIKSGKGKPQEEVVGNLGGMPIRMPRYIAENVEYNGDPAVGEKTTDLRSKPTLESRFRSFGMAVRYPDMVGLASAEMRILRRNEPLNNKWLRISINAGTDYPGDGFLDRLAAGMLLNAFSPSFKGHWQYSYERLKENSHGLEMWALSMLDPRTNQPARFSEGAKDIYLHRNDAGLVDAYIECSKPRVPNGVGTCRLHTHLEPRAKVVVMISFVPDLLPEWSAILQRSRQLLIGFEVGNAG